MIVKIRIHDIVIPQGLLPRIFGVNEEKVQEYAEAIEQGAEFPPIKVWKKTEQLYQVIDGVHRLTAYRKLGKEYIEAELVDVKDDVDFMVKAIAENSKHGLPLSRDDKRESARRLYIKGMNEEDIAKIFGVSIRTVYRWIGDIKDKQEEELRQKAIELRNSGLIQKQIANILGVAQNTISNWLNDFIKNCHLSKIDKTGENDFSKNLQMQKITKTGEEEEKKEETFMERALRGEITPEEEAIFQQYREQWMKEKQEKESKEEDDDIQIEIVPVKFQEKKEKLPPDPDEIFEDARMRVEEGLAIVLDKWGKDDALALLQEIEAEILANKYTRWQGYANMVAAGKIKIPWRK